MDVKDLAKDAGPDRELKSQNIPDNLQHDFDKNEICKKCGAESFTKGVLCTGKKLPKDD
jgi:hypothetical protein